MSWYVSFYARNKTVAVARIRAEQVSNVHFPGAIADALAATVGWLPEAPNKAVAVTSSGSGYGEGGTATSSIQTVEFLE